MFRFGSLSTRISEASLRFIEGDAAPGNCLPRADTLRAPPDARQGRRRVCSQAGADWVGGLSSGAAAGPRREPAVSNCMSASGPRRMRLMKVEAIRTACTAIVD
jgi:hypothetical protein